jgi:transcriptional regulator with XRE-family HTH domain
MNRLKELRLQHGYKSQQELANALFVNQTAVSQWERGVTVPSSQMLVRLSELFGVSIEYMLGSSNTQKETTQLGGPEITFDDFTYAMYGETKDLPQEKKDMLLGMARFMRQELDKEKGTQQ